MDTGDDFIKSEFLHLLFFEQKNLVIFPYVDLKHFRSLDLFTVGFETVDIDSTVIHNLNEIIEYESNSSYSQLQTLYFILNPSLEELERLVESPQLRCVINSKENVETLANGDQFVFYNKKNNTFLNYAFESRDLSFEKEILGSSPNKQAIMDELLKIKSISSKIFAELNQNNSPENLSEILDEYEQKYWNKILRFTELYCQIKIPEFNRPVQLPKRKNSSTEIDFSAEYEAIIKTNRKMGRSFIKLIHDYRYDRVNPANLEVTQLFYPQKLYNYLRNHHWKKGMSKEFAINWLKNATKDFSDPEEALLEFQVILNKLHLSYSVSDIDLEHKNEPEIKARNRSEKEEPINNTQQPRKTLVIPSIDNFPEFKKWLLNKLAELEKIV
ncbi:MAG: hypothetical protein KGD68_10515 [Candidatus Lokiarchaeota archaeon]|nr:hypothetical protein [Candidatus Lokiarchaeota archaeon]